MKYFLAILLLFVTSFVFSQQKKIKIIHADVTFAQEDQYPDAIVAMGNVLVEHEGAILQCKQALIYQKSNVVKAFGDVLIKQGDTLTQTSKYVDYNGNTKIAKSWGNVVLKDTKMTLTTDTLHFDRNQQLLYYDDRATIKDATNTLNSQIGKYFLREDKFQAIGKVEITNPDNTIYSDHLDYYTKTGISNLFGPTTIKDSVNTLYSEKGYHNSKTKISHFTKNAKLFYKDRVLESDSLYYDEIKQYAASSGNITVTDTINKMIIKGQYSEYFKKIDSVYMVGKPYVAQLIEKDSMFIHGDTLLVTGKSKERIVRAYHRVKFFKTDLQGKCDSLYSNEKQGITKMFRLPVLWNEQNQITGDSIHFLSNPKTQKIDSLKVYHNAFVISLDSTGGFSQIKGKFLYGKFLRDTLDNVFVQGNGQFINYSRNEKKELVGITKMVCSDMSFQLKKGNISTVNFITKPDGKTYPPSKFPKEEERLPGFVWRLSERPMKKEDIFIRDIKDDTLIPEVIEAEKKAKKEANENEKLKKIAQEKNNNKLDTSANKDKEIKVNKE